MQAALTSNGGNRRVGPPSDSSRIRPPSVNAQRQRLLAHQQVRDIHRRRLSGASTPSQPERIWPTWPRDMVQTGLLAGWVLARHPAPSRRPTQHAVSGETHAPVPRCRGVQGVAAFLQSCFTPWHPASCLPGGRDRLASGEEKEAPAQRGSTRSMICSPRGAALWFTTLAFAFFFHAIMSGRKLPGAQQLLDDLVEGKWRCWQKSPASGASRAALIAAISRCVDAGHTLDTSCDNQRVRRSAPRLCSIYRFRRRSRPGCTTAPMSMSARQYQADPPRPGSRPLWRRSGRFTPMKGCRSPRR